MDFSSLNIRRWFLLAFALSCLGINAFAYVVYMKNQQLVRSSSWVTHSYDVLTHFQAMFNALQDMLTAQRGYLITGNEDFLKPYSAASGAVDERYRQILTLTLDNGDRQRDLPGLKAAMDAQRALMERQISDRRGGGPISLPDMYASRRNMNEVRALNARIIADEKTLLNLRMDEEERHQRNYVTTIFATAGAAIIGLLMANGAILFLTLRRQAAEADLIRANREMEGFTYIASHDLRSPLVNLKGFSSEMKYGVDELRPILDKALAGASDEERKTVARILDEDIRDALHYIQASVEKMDKLTNAILELSRIGRRQLKFETVDVNTIVRRCLDTLQHQIGEKRISVTTHPMPAVVADALSLEQIFGNIIDNAVKYLERDRPGTIEIGGSRNYRETTYWVRDNGRGIGKADMEKIFEIYRRGGNNEHIPGEGMGMAYVRATLRRLSGNIWCESAPGAGTTFYFTVSNTLKKDS